MPFRQSGRKTRSYVLRFKYFQFWHVEISKPISFSIKIHRTYGNVYFFQRIFHSPDYYSCSPFSSASCQIATLSVSVSFPNSAAVNRCLLSRFGQSCDTIRPHTHKRYVNGSQNKNWINQWLCSKNTGGQATINPIELHCLSSFTRAKSQTNQNYNVRFTFWSFVLLCISDDETLAEPQWSINDVVESNRSIRFVDWISKSLAPRFLLFFSPLICL
jgi:hypothetical protein